MKTLVEFIKKPWYEEWYKEADETFRKFFEAGGRYKKSVYEKKIAIRSPKIEITGEPYFALIHPANAESGPYGGMSFVIFPTKSNASIISLVVGTQGLAPDESILGRPGHARRLNAICNYINHTYGNGKRIAWAKKDPCRTESPIPSDVINDFSSEDQEQESILEGKYSNVIYAFVDPQGLDNDATEEVLKMFLDLMVIERDASGLLRGGMKDYEQISQKYLAYLLPNITQDQVEKLLDQRKYVIIEGPPGTGKTRMALEIARSYDHSRTIQFHPNTTYEQFIGGLFPEKKQDGFGFAFVPKPGALMQSVIETKANEKHLLHIDEINRADLAKVLGEAILLFEPNSDEERHIDLNYDFDTIGTTLTMPKNLHVLGTMNSADRSIAILDIAIRRRFAFVRLYPQMNVVNQYGDDLTKDAFTRLLRIFIEYSSDDSFKLMPGHSYFIIKEGEDSKTKLRTELLPLLEEYIEQGYVAGFEDEIRAYIQELDVKCGE